MSGGPAHRKEGPPGCTDRECTARSFLYLLEWLLAAALSGAAGTAGMLSSTMNVPIAAAVITIEVFGLWYSLPAGLAAVVGFQINRHNTIYDAILSEWGRLPEAPAED